MLIMLNSALELIRRGTQADGISLGLSLILSVNYYKKSP